MYVGEGALGRAGGAPRTQQGASGRQICQALNALGFGYVNAAYSGKTFRTFKCPKGDVVMLFNKSHVVAVTDSVVRDWSNGSLRRVIGAIKVYPLEVN